MQKQAEKIKAYLERAIEVRAYMISIKKKDKPKGKWESFDQEMLANLSESISYFEVVLSELTDGCA